MSATHSTRSMDTNKNPGNVAGGLKAAIHNPNVSEEAKSHAAERLREMGGDDQPDTMSASNPAGYSDGISHFQFEDQGESITRRDVDYAREILEAVGYSVEQPSETTEDEHQTRVLAGYKAALSNPRVSKEAKQHAQDYLDAHGATAD
ncbi:hypothetical protein BDN71DRAFT_1429169 [Pleurotus eryngii]|uniref:Conidiation-specific protein 6 n=1 Tax=Pleurotus eryngii TaxID=5323 RepID=A0A9P6DHI9_PLEER|nr:hypothetical protein BDN71DRAFT_1429169 [Pleurotus eryngii]